MGQILSQSEVESILSALNVTESASPSIPGRNQFIDDNSLYDFEHPEPLRRSQLENLKRSAASVTQTLQISLTKVLQAKCGVKFLEVEQSTYHDYLTTAEKPCCIAVYEVESSQGIWLFDIHQSVALTMIDMVLGGQILDSSPSGTPPKSFTLVESKLIERVLQSILPDLAASFTRQTEFSMTRLTSDAYTISEIKSNEAVVILSFDIMCGGKQGLLQLCVPWRDVVKVNSFPIDRCTKPDDRSRSVAVKVPVTAIARVAELRLSARELATLSPGDVLLTDVSRSKEMTLEVDGRTLFRGIPGQSGNQKVIQLTVPVSPATNSEQFESGLSIVTFHPEANEIDAN